MNATYLDYGDAYKPVPVHYPTPTSISQWATRCGSSLPSAQPDPKDVRANLPRPLSPNLISLLLKARLPVLRLLAPLGSSPSRSHFDTTL